MTSSRTRLRHTFNEVAETYDSARSPYPEQLIQDLLSDASIGPNSSILEIGCGPGLCTAPLARSGARILALELGPQLVAVATSRLQSWSNVKVELADFDLWSPPTDHFDVVLVATAFHWLDPTTRAQKCHAVLERTGVLAIVDTHWGVGRDISDFSLAIQACYARWDPNHEPGFVPQTLRDLPSEHTELMASGLFPDVYLKRYTVSRQYSADQFCSLLNTYSDVRSFQPQARNGFLASVRDLITSSFAGTVDRSDSYSLWLARPHV